MTSLNKLTKAQLIEKIRALDPFYTDDTGEWRTCIDCEYEGWGDNHSPDCLWSYQNDIKAKPYVRKPGDPPEMNSTGVVYTPPGGWFVDGVA